MALGKRVITVFCIFLPSILLIALFPFYFVKADGATYYLYNTLNSTFQLTSGNNPWYFQSNTTSRIVCLSAQNYTTYNYIYMIFESEPVAGVSSSTPVSVENIGDSQSYNGNRYYYIKLQYSYDNSTVNVPIVYVSYGNQSSVSQAIKYTFGDGAIDPEPPSPTYGDLIIEGYSTDIAGQGEASINNIDHIKWNGYIDSNGNNISDCKVRLQIVPGKYTGSSKNDLTNKTRQDFIIDPINASDSLFDASIGEVSFSWRDIVNRIDIIPYRLYSLELLGPDWQKDGWIYQLRLEDEENDYIGEWQTVYSSTSNGVQNDLNITNITTINQTLVQTFQELNSINNVENNWIFNNTEISVENNYTESQSGEKPWYIYLLESILNTFNITNNYIYEGDSNTQNITNTVNDSDDDMNNKIGEYQQFEDSFIDNMDDNLSDIDTDVDFLLDNKFIASANWVAQQYNRMTNNTVIGSFIGFSLLFGLALIFIGKIR